MKCEEGSVSDSEYQHEDGGWDLDANDVLDAMAIQVMTR
jgi:hypothetical protein